MKAWLLSALLAIAVAIGSVLVSAAGGGQTRRDDPRVLWVESALRRMQTIKPGMTRKELLDVFTTEGGISTPLHRTFVSKDCPYFKVDVEFEAVGRPGRDQSGRLLMVEGQQDRIVKISRPFLENSVVD